MTDPYEGFAIVELLGRRRLAGKCSHAEQYGTAMLRLDIPDGEGWSTMFVGGSSIYALTPTTEEVVRAVALRNQPEPVHTWELPRSRAEATDLKTCPGCGDEHDGPDDLCVDCLEMAS